MKNYALFASILSGCLVAGAVLVFAADPPIPANKPDYFPAWWFSRGVIKQNVNPPLTNPTWPDNYPVADDFAGANLGQVKFLATAAYDEFNTHLPGGAGSALDTLVKGWFQLDGSGNFQLDNNHNRIPKVNTNTDDFGAANQGQLKAVAAGFYDRLITVTYAKKYPWAGGSADDYAGANLGQLKNLFGFDLRGTDATHDADVPPNGLPDWWERYYFGHSGIDATALSPSGDGRTNLAEFLGGYSPFAPAAVLTVTSPPGATLGQ